MRYLVNATVSVAAWVEVIADDSDEALEIARGMSSDSFDYDFGTAEVDFNVTPAVEAL